MSSGGLSGRCVTSQTCRPSNVKDVPPARVALPGYQQLVRGEAFRGKFRNSFEHPEPFVSGKVEEVDFKVLTTSATPSGKGIESWCRYEFVVPTDRSQSQTFVNILEAKPEDFRKAARHLSRKWRCLWGSGTNSAAHLCRAYLGSDNYPSSIRNKSGRSDSGRSFQ